MEYVIYKSEALVIFNCNVKMKQKMVRVETWAYMYFFFKWFMISAVTSQQTNNKELEVSTHSA